jgi:hypothetical protein
MGFRLGVFEGPVLDKGAPCAPQGSLRLNLAERPWLDGQLGALDFSYTNLFQDIHGIRKSEFSTWDQQDWLCLQCIEEIIRSHLHLWLLERKRKGKFTIIYLVVPRHMFLLQLG